jgi:CRP-like cAMP-binding protein
MCRVHKEVIMTVKHINQLSFLQKIYPFNLLDEKNITNLAADFHEQIYEKGDTIFQQGDIGRELFVVYRRRVHIFSIYEDGRDICVNILGPGSLLGEFSLIDGGPRSATAQAIDSCTLLQITQDKFQLYLYDNPHLAMGMCKLVTEKARQIANWSEAIVHCDAGMRFLHLLLVYNTQFGEEIGDSKKYEINLGLNQEGLALMIGVTRAWLSKKLKMWHEEELLVYKRDKIVILDLAKIQNKISPKK